MKTRTGRPFVHALPLLVPSVLEEVDVAVCAEETRSKGTSEGT